ncbi:MAG TPA: cytochrome P450 [Acidimicrobiales bacterium]|nr:cytochrome P450 [Acidimicrobiales bacterium]
MAAIPAPGPSTAPAAVEFDPFSADFFEDPYATYRRLRDEAPVYHSRRYGFYALSRYDDVVAAHRDWETFSSSHGVDLSMLSRPPEEARALRSIIMMDPPAHDRLRGLVNRVFTPRAVAGLEPMVRHVIGGYLDGLDGPFDAVADFAGPFPVEIICRMLGVPAGDRQQIRHWIDVQLHRQPGDMHPTEAGTRAGYEMGAYFYELVAAKRRQPADDMLTRLTQVEVDRGDGRTTALDDAEIAGFAALLGGAGAETVTKLVGNAVVLFDRHPDQWQLVGDDPGRIPQAVEELLRYWPPSQYQGRFSQRDAHLHGQTIPAGHPVLLITGAATRDERAFADPDRFDVTRRPGLAIGFGHGVHSCLGAALARLESRVALEELGRRWPRYRVDVNGLRRVQMANVAGYSNVPVTPG